MQRQIRVDFRHGVGDSAHFAQVIALLRRRGFPVKVCGFPDLLSIFRAVGAEVSSERVPEMVVWAFRQPAKRRKAINKAGVFILP